LRCRYYDVKIINILKFEKNTAFFNFTKIKINITDDLPPIKSMPIPTNIFPEWWCYFSILKIKIFNKIQSIIFKQWI
jgi:hypothetical protein